MFIKQNYQLCYPAIWK